ncbi:MAG: DUF1080 domain-containing protein [Bryobacter sp.]|nr:DUF1080 domain-containing protein [Bryobacter sp.]
MRNVTLLLLTLAAVNGYAAKKDFEGRWNLSVDNEPRGRAWWLEVTGVRKGPLGGSFVGAPGGQVDKIEKMEFQGQELHWYFEKGKAPNVRKLHYSATLNGGLLTGKAMEGEKVIATFRGKRAPEIRDRDDDRWKPGTPIELFNGKDLANWSPRFPGRPMQWAIVDGTLRNEPKASDIQTKETFWNFELHAEYRYGKGSNSGIALRGRYEVQIEDSFGRPADLHTHGALYSRIPPSVNAANPPGEWQTMDVRLVGRTLTVKLNGKLILDKVTVEGPTAMGFSPEEEMPGPFALQGDHGLVEFRKLTVTPLVRQ